jgi:hypothetical protein
MKTPLAEKTPAGTYFIRKPYKPQVLAQTVRDALDDNFNRCPLAVQPP